MIFTALLFIIKARLSSRQPVFLSSRPDSWVRELLWFLYYIKILVVFKTRVLIWIRGFIKHLRAWSHVSDGGAKRIRQFSSRGTGEHNGHFEWNNYDHAFNSLQSFLLGLENRGYSKSFISAMVTRKASVNNIVRLCRWEVQGNYWG